MANRQHIAICVLVAAACLAVYGQMLRHDFINYDDDRFVTGNAHVQAGLTWRGVTWPFTNHREIYLIPVTWLTHMLDCQIYGLRPWGHHLTSLILHTLNSMPLFLVLRRMTGALWPSGLAALISGTHAF